MHTSIFQSSNIGSDNVCGYVFFICCVDSLVPVFFLSVWIVRYPHSSYICMVSSTYANILKYHIQGMPTNILLQVFI